MTLVAVRSLLGLGSVPRDRSSATAWLARHRVPVSEAKGNGGTVHLVRLADLPEPERRAYLGQQIAAAGLPAGKYDEEAHRAYLAAAPSLRAEAERRAEAVRIVQAMPEGATWPDRLAALRGSGHELSRPTLRRYLATVEGVAPVNHAPALLPAHKGRTARAEMSPDAWRHFLTTIRDAFEGFPIKQAWRDTRDLAMKKGWEWPTYPTVLRRWKELPEAQRLPARYGRERAAKMLSQPILRDKTSIGPLEWVSLDGRELDLWTDFGDGRLVRPTLLILADVASNAVLGWRLCRTENAADTAALIVGVCEEYGIFDRLYTDNGMAFKGHLVAGWANFRFGKAGSTTVPLPGVCDHLGIEVRFALPRNAQAKIAERIFADFSRVIDDRAEFKGAHAGHKAGATAGSGKVAVPFETLRSVYAERIKKYNEEPGRRSQGANGRSYEQVLRDGLQLRMHREATPRQLWLARLQYKAASVDRDGRVHVNTWTYGDASTQEKLLKFHGAGPILIGRDPSDFSAPAVAFERDGTLISDCILPVKRGRYGSVEGAREAAKNRKAARAAVAAGEAANDYLAEAEFQANLAALGGGETPAAPKSHRVVKARFAGPLSTSRTTAEGIPEEYRRNMDRALGLTAAGG